MNRFFAKRQPPITRKATFRPRIEELESRTLLATDLGVLISLQNQFGILDGIHPEASFNFTLAAEATFRADGTSTGPLSKGLFIQLFSGGDFLVNSHPVAGSESHEAVNITLPAGNYELTLHGGPFNFFTLNLGADYAGEMLDTARNLGTVASPQFFSDYVSGKLDEVRDVQDFYRLSTFTSSTITATLSGLTDNADLYLIQDSNNDGQFDSGSDEIVGRSELSGTSSELISRPGADGTFFLLVTPGTGVVANYSLSLTVTPVDRAGNTLGNARGDIGTLTSTPRHFTDFVGNVDKNDFYKFNLAAPGPFTLSATLDTLSADANLELIRDGQTLAVSSNTGTTPETISKTLNDAGTYFVRVRQGSGDTAYALTLSAVSTDIAGNTPANALKINPPSLTLNGRQTFTDFVGAVDADDFYKFALAAGSLFKINLSCLSANADVDLIEESTGNSVGGFFNGGFTNVGASQGNLAAGTYFVHVKGVGDTNYTLTLTPDFAGNGLLGARIVSAGTFNDFVGSTDTNDFYQITLANDSIMAGTLSGLGADANLQLIFNANQNLTVDAGEVLASSFSAGTASDSFTRALAKGSYFVRVIPGVLNRTTLSTNYQLALSVTPGSASIAGTMFEDIDRNGVRGAGDLPQVNAVVFLDANGNGLREDTERFSVTNNLTGSYSFTGLNAGTYQVRQIVPVGFLPSGGFYTVTLGAGQAVTSRDFGNVRSPASISGLVFNDVDGNGANGAGDLPLGNAVVFLDANNNGTKEDAEKATQTNDSGNYSFTDLNAGVYLVRQIVPPGFLAVPTAPAGGVYSVTLSAGQNVTGRDFGNARPASILGLVFDDVNGNGVNGAGDSPLGSVVVFLDADNNGTRQAAERFVQTTASGFYTFTDLSAGTYQVRQELPAGFLALPTVPGSGFYTVTLSPGQTAFGRDFGNVRPASIAGQVFEDLNGNSVRDANDSARAGWTIFLDTNNNLARDALEPEKVSDGLGNYSFTDLRPGSYSVFQVLQPGFTQTLPAGTHSVALTSGQSATGKNFAFSQLIVDNIDAIQTGTWVSKTDVLGFFGTDYLQDGNTNKGNMSVKFTANIPVNGSYQVFARWTAKDNRATNVPIDIVHRDGTATVRVNQQQNGGVFFPLGTPLFFNAGPNGIVVIRNGGTSGQVVADAIQFVRMPPVAPSNLVATMLPGSQVLLTWRDNSLSEAGFKLQRSTDPHFEDFEEVTLPTPNTTNFTDTVKPDRHYYYRVVAYGVSGRSRISNIVEVSTLLEVPALSPKKSLGDRWPWQGWLRGLAAWGDGVA